MSLSKKESKYTERKHEEVIGFFDLFVFVGPATYLLFWIADYIKFPEHSLEFFIIRLSFCLCVWGCQIYFKTGKKKSFLAYQLTLIGLCAIASSGIVYMMALTEGPASIYFCGINLVAIFTLSLSLFDKYLFVLAGAVIYAPYFTLCFFDFSSFRNWQNFVVYSFFTVGTILGIAVTRHRREQDAERIIDVELKLEDELSKREAIIEQKTAEAMALKYNETLVMISQQVAHDIRSPLSVVNLLLPALANDKNDEKQKIILDALKRINETSEDLLSVSRKQARGAKFCIENAVNDIRKEKELQHSIDIKFTSTLNGLIVENLLNEISFKRVISNLLNNSIDALKSKLDARVEISVDILQDKIRILITDNGIGIPNEKLKMVGQRGFSYGKEASKVSGSGLGVYHAQCVVEAFGGSLSLESRSVGDTGTVVTIIIPVAHTLNLVS